MNDPDAPACPMPLEWHPAYADKTWLVDWLNGEGQFAAMWDVQITSTRGIGPAVFTDKDSPPPVSAPAYTVQRLTRQRCAGLAPYVGRPFVYTWMAAIDDLGRGIAGESHIEYMQEW